MVNSGKGSYVNILGWTGLVGDDDGTATNDRLLFVSDPGFASADLANWQFSDDQGVNVGSGAMEINFEIVPVPEPATWMVGTLLVSVAGMMVRRRVGRSARCLSN